MSVYLDYNATAPVRPEAAEAIARALMSPGNPSSVHAAGRAARALVEQARTEPAADHVGQRHRGQIAFDLPAHLLPEVVGQALLALEHAALALGVAAGGAQRLVHGHDNVGDVGLRGGPGQPIAAAGTARTLHQTAPPQPREELFQIGERDLLAYGDLGQGDGAAALLGAVLTARQVGHGHDSVAAFGAEAHGPVLPRAFFRAFDEGPMLQAAALRGARAWSRPNGLDLGRPSPRVKYSATPKT